MAADLAGRVFRSALRKKLALLLNGIFRVTSCHGALLPVLELGVHFELALGKAHQCLDGSIHFVVGGDSLARLVPTKGGKCHDLFVPAEIHLRHAINLSNAHRHFQIFDLHGKLFPGWMESLTPDTPGGEHVDKGHFVLFNPTLKVVLGQIHGVDPVLLVHLFQRPIVILVSNLALLPVASTEQTGAPVFRDLPLFDVLGHVLSVRPEGIPDIYRDVIAMDIEHGNVEIQPQLGLCVFIECNRGDNLRSGKGGRFTEKEDPHYAQSDQRHCRTQCGCLCQILGHTAIKIHRRHCVPTAASAVDVIAHGSRFFWFCLLLR
mmetsp:Transcript_8833/g.18351  ORF Transcript_8833/g.18351 Transcript_8833/m.18351 type:complete len:319 (-) Transcript_8833:36-992(-)